MIHITLRNYRGFATDSPAEFSIGQGFTSFVGRNNAGKSTCLRAIYELRTVFQNHNIWIGTQNGAQGFNVESEPDINVLFNYGNEEPIFVTLSIDATLAAGEYCLVRSTISINRNGTFELISIGLLTTGNPIELRPPFGVVTGVSLTSGYGIQVNASNASGVAYVTQKFVEALTMLSSSVYFGPYRNAINEGAARHYDISVGTGLIGQWNDWKAGINIANRRAITKVEADIERLLGYKSVEINASSDEKTLNVTVDKHPFKLADLGAGVAELIITLSTALVRKPTFILIDEPESHLHPSLQVDFLTTLAGYATQGIAFSTHSIGLARSVADRIYSVTRDNQTSKCMVFEKHPHLAELLGNLSYSGYFPAENAFVLLVEGSSEVRTFQILLRKLKKDHAYVILTLGGSQLIRENSDIELTEVVRIAGGADKVFAVVDSEKPMSDAALGKERIAFKKICEKLGIQCHLTERRATENYFSDTAIKKAFGENFSALSEYDLLKNQQNGWPKSENWRIAGFEENSFFQAHDLGNFLLNLPSK